MKISLIQESIEWLKPSLNRAVAEQWIAKAQGSDLCLFSEMFTTGFCESAIKASKGGEQTLEWMVEMANQYQTAIGGSVAIEEQGEFYNRFFVVEKCGKINYYDKHHLFTFAGEDNNYKAGDQRVIITLEGVRIMLLVCYDLRFPVWIRNRGDFDLIACVAAWPAPRRRAWDTLLRARAIENQCYICGVNMVGSDPSCNYSGGTAAIDFMGGTIDSVDDNESGIATMQVDMDALNNFRDKFPFLRDGDNFEIR